MTPTAVSAAAEATTSAASGGFQFGNLKVVGIVLAVASGVLIGASFPLKKKGLLRSQEGGQAGEGVAYLKSVLWWAGMIMMILGEICNFAAYAFVEAIVVTPLGALSVVISAILSSIFLKETLSFFGWLGCALCILGSVIIALNGPHEASVGQIREFQKLFLSPGFLAWGAVLIVASLVIILYFAPRYGKKSMLWYISVCSMIGGLSVSVTTGLGAAIVTSATGDNQFKYWFIYFLLGFVVITLLTEIYYLNVALAMYNTAMVTPTYYVIFTFFTMVTTIILFKGLKAPVVQIITIVMGFLVICFGITILQMSKIDPKNLGKLDRRSTLLLQAARTHTDEIDEKGEITHIEDPGIDTLRGSFGTVGSIIRARTAKRLSQSSRLSRGATASGAWDPHHQARDSNLPDRLSGMKRHQLYDAPVPRVLGQDDAHSLHSVNSLTAKRPTIKFDNRDLIHSYNRPGTGDNTAKHEHRQALGSPAGRDGSYPPLPPMPASGQHLMGSALPQLPRDSTASLDNIAGLGANNRLENSGSGQMNSSGNVGSTTAVGSVGSLKDFDFDFDKGSKDSGSLSQLLAYPPLLGREHDVHSAPASVYNRYRPSAPTRKDSRDVFDPAAVRETLLSFPSVTDSAASQDWSESELEKIRQADWERQERENRKNKSNISLAATLGISGSHDKSKDRGSARSSKVDRKYPKTDADSDLEESESLWRRSLENESEEGGSTASHGIRLVQSRK